MARKMIIFERTSNCICIRTISKDGAKHRYKYRSSSFYIPVYKFDILKQYGAIADRDIHSFIDIGVMGDNKEFLAFEICWLNHNGYDDVKGEMEKFVIKSEEFLKWLQSANEGDRYKTLNLLDNKSAKIIVNSRKNLKEVLANKLVKRKFIKKIIGFQNWRADEIRIYDDFVDYSFGFSEWRGDKRLIFGGIILHRDWDNADDFTKANYSVHT